MKKIYLLFVLSILFTISIFAQSPEKLSYQAIIRNSSDIILANQGIGIQTSILQGSASGAVVYSEVQNPTTNANGLISIEIGNGTLISGDITTIDWAADSYFIKTEIDIDGGTNYTITGSSQLMSVPYALHSKTAESVTGVITETDPIFTTSVAHGISGSDITTWNNKLDNELDGSITNEIELPSGGTDGQVLKTDGSGNYTWVDQTLDTDTNTQLDETAVDAFVSNNGYLTVEVDGSITNEIELPTGGTDGQVLKTDGSGNYTWVNQVTDTDTQDLSLTGNTISLVDGGSIDVSTATSVAANTTKIGLPAGGVTGQILNINGSGNPEWTTSVSILEYGDIKTGIQNSDHNGWLLLDGRAISSLTASQQTQAANLGLTGNLPDARDKYLSYSPSESANFGSNGFNLTKANLPTDTFSGTTDYVYNSNATISPGQFGLMRLSVAGEPVTTSTTDTPGASIEADLLTTPIDHRHNFSMQLNNTQTAIDNRPATLNVRMFLYLGQ